MRVGTFVRYARTWLAIGHQLPCWYPWERCTSTCQRKLSNAVHALLNTDNIPLSREEYVYMNVRKRQTHIAFQIAGSWDQNGASPGPTGPWWAPWWPQSTLLPGMVAVATELILELIYLFEWYLILRMGFYYTYSHDNNSFRIPK